MDTLENRSPNTSSICFSSSSDQCISSSKRALTIRFQLSSQVCAVHAALTSTSTSLQHSTLGNSIQICFYVPQETRNPKVRVRAQSASTWFSASGLTALMQSITRTMYVKRLRYHCGALYRCTAGAGTISTAVLLVTVSKVGSLPRPEATPHWCETLPSHIMQGELVVPPRLIFLDFLHPLHEATQGWAIHETSISRLSRLRRIARGGPRKDERLGTMEGPNRTCARGTRRKRERQTPHLL